MAKKEEKGQIRKRGRAKREGKGLIRKRKGK